jgi:glyoxylase-like metal-dependent hydrolase (beta-lactamase superfamily II)
MSRALRRLEFRHGSVVRLGGTLVSAHLLVDAAGLTLIDAGLWGVGTELRQVVKALGRRPGELRNIILTHGHLDHAGGAAEIQEWSGGARVWVHAADREHVLQQVCYQGITRLCRVLEKAGTWLGGYRVSEMGGELIDGQVLPFWGGLRVWHLPGHTPGHCALVSEANGLVFSGDLFASYAWSVHAPPRFLSRDSKRTRGSLRQLAEAQPQAVLPSHYDWMDPAQHARRLQRLCFTSGGGGVT